MATREAGGVRPMAAQEAAPARRPRRETLVAPLILFRFGFWGHCTAGIGEARRRSTPSFPRSDLPADRLGEYPGAGRGGGGNPGRPGPLTAGEPLDVVYFFRPGDRKMEILGNTDAVVRRLP